jgi:hypothetical protein
VKSGDDHMAMTVYKVPPNFQGPVGVVNSGGGGIFGIGAATDDTMTLNSVDVEQRTDDVPAAERRRAQRVSIRSSRTSGCSPSKRSSMKSEVKSA